MNKGAKSPWCRVGHRAQGDWMLGGEEGPGWKEKTRAHPFPSLPISYCASLTQGLGLSRGCQAQLHWVDAAQKVASAWAIFGSGQWVRDQETEIATISMAPWGCFAVVEAYTQATLSSSLPALS